MRLLFCGLLAVVACGEPVAETETSEAQLSVAPERLRCIARHFTGTPKDTPRGWVLELSDGAAIPWDDGKTKTFDETLDDPDLEDTLSIPYRTGPLVPVTKENDDPGRIRVDALYRATYGATPDEVSARLVNVDFVGQNVMFHKKAAPALDRVAARLKRAMRADRSLAAFLTGELGGTFNWRVIAGTSRLSAHSFATAIDIVVAKSDYWRSQLVDGRFTYKNRIPRAIVDAFEAEGFAWGGRWYHYDTMHFEYRPELFDPACKP
jgi:hypothetical protein